MGVWGFDCVGEEGSVCVGQPCLEVCSCLVPVSWCVGVNVQKCVGVIVWVQVGVSGCDCVGENGSVWVGRP